MKKIRFICLLLITTMFCSLLCGCVSHLSAVQINSDGSGTITTYFGLTEYGLELLKRIEANGKVIEYPEQMEKFDYDGIKYFGESKTFEFSNVKEFNSIMNSRGEKLAIDIDSGVLELVKNGEEFILYFDVTENTGDISEIEKGFINEFSDISEEELTQLKKEINMSINIKFPSDIYLIEGSMEGMSISGNELILDIFQMSKYITKDFTYVFSTNKNSEASHSIFKDVPRDFWGYNAIQALAKGKLILGVGDDKYDPNRFVSYAEFCEVLSRAKGFETGSDKTNYWAEKGIKNCLDNKYINSLGEINVENYNVSITREAAIAAIYLSKADVLFIPSKIHSPEDIPDYDNISPEYSLSILRAYNFGITGGVDSKKTFNPKGYLTRAELAQLFYNLKWTKKDI